MRSDMAKVIVERPRWGHALRYRAVRRGKCPYGPAIDDAPVIQGMRKPHTLGRERKEFTDLLGPLRRFFEHRVGRRWDAVFAEICAVTDRRSGIDGHLHSHIGDVLDRHAVRDDEGRLWSRRHGWRFEVRGVYVDPDDGVIRKAPPRRRPLATTTPDAIRVRAEFGYRKIGGIWYAVTYRPIPERRVERRVDADGPVRIVVVEEGKAYDIFDGLVGRGPVGWGRSAPVRTHHAVAKRQLSGPELRRAGLRNDPPA